MKLKKLLKNVPDVTVKGSKEIEITGLASDSRTVASGNLFIAKKGLSQEGAHYIPDAIASGAAAVLTDIYDPFFPEVVQLIHPDVSLIEAELARAFYHDVDKDLFLIGITGTNGKTTTSYLIKYLLDHLLKSGSCGLIGSIERIVGQHIFPSPQNTPDIITNYKLFHEMVLNGCESCVMEVTSHGLDQQRVRGIEFDIALFTNLTQDHLDYHKTMQAYAASKAAFFSSLADARKSFKRAIVNVDCPWHTEMVANCRVPILTYGIDVPCDVRAERIQLSALHTEFDVVYKDQRLSLCSPLIGRFNIYNLLAAISVILARGFDLERVGLLERFSQVPGRLERVPNPRNLSIFVDYAHTDDALKNVLQTLCEFKMGRLIIVFGCGGARDALKRPKMGAIAEAFSDKVIVTSDNTRHEEPMAIIRDILAGFKAPERACVVVDREEAIRQAIQIATPKDIVLIAGKGHEKDQVFSHRTIAFDDRVIASRACSDPLFG